MLLLGTITFRGTDNALYGVRFRVTADYGNSQIALYLPGIRQ
jgi:hypothetical protein